MEILMSEQDCPISVNTTRAQKKALYQSKTLWRTGTGLLCCYLFSLFMLSCFDSVEIANSNKSTVGQGTNKQTYSDQLTSISAQQRSLWGDDPLLIARGTAQMGPFTLPEDTLTANFFGIISYRSLFSAMHCMTRGFSKILSGFKYIFYKSGAFMR